MAVSRCPAICKPAKLIHVQSDRALGERETTMVSELQTFWVHRGEDNWWEPTATLPVGGKKKIN